jgi:hypothetical protein
MALEIRWLSERMSEKISKEELAGCAGATCGGRLVSSRYICQTILLLRWPKPDSRELRLTTLRHSDGSRLSALEGVGKCPLPVL